eukprot:1185907-Prorocentrum_minimum.AAC.5
MSCGSTPAPRGKVSARGSAIEGWRAHNSRGGKSSSRGVSPWRGVSVGGSLWTHVERWRNRGFQIRWIHTPSRGRIRHRLLFASHVVIVDVLMSTVWPRALSKFWITYASLDSFQVSRARAML